jgi:hypothetical protein
MLIKYYKIKPLLSLSLLALAVFFSACDDDDESANSGQVELLSFGHSGVHHGEEIRFIGNNLDKVNAIELPGATVDKSAFTEQTSEIIVIVVPVAAEEGFVTLKTSDADIVSKTVLSFEVPVAIETITEESRPGATITITGDFMNWVTEVWFAEDLVVTEFVSQTLNELVVTVPTDAQTGPISLWTGGTEPLVIETEKDLIVTLPNITGLTPNPIARGAELTITGTDLDLTMGILFKGLTEPVTDFEIISATELVVTVPEEANQGKISLVVHSLLQVESEEALALEGALPPLAPLGVAFYVDALQNGWQKWGGWGGGSSDLASTDNVRDGTTAIKVIFASDWGGPLQLGGGNTSTAGRTEIAFSIFGGPGTGGKELNALVKGGSTEEKIITMVEGEWTEFKIPLADFGNPATITEFIFQSRGWAGTIYVDHIGLR